MKRMLSILLTLCMLLSMIPAVVAADNTIAGSDVSWSFDADTGLLTLEGTGPMPEFSNTTKVPWRAHKNAIKAVDIAEGITTIGKYAFNGHSALTEVCIPNSVTYIGERSFYGCSGLVSLALGNGVTEFGALAFGYCEKLATVTLGSGITKLLQETFKNCNSIAQVYYMGTESEWDDVVIENNNGGLYDLPEEKLFFAKPLPSGTYMGTAWTFDPMTFTLTVSGEGEMEDFADGEQDWFDYRKAIHTVVIESGITAIGKLSFRDHQNIHTVYIPASVTEIGDNAFALCKGLKDVYYGSSQEDWASITKGANANYLTAAKIHYAGDCAHTNVTEKVISTGEGTHFVQVVCACGITVSETEPEACGDEDADGKCDFCGGDVERVCKDGIHYYGEVKYFPNDKEADVFYTHTVVDYCTKCEEEYGKPYVEACSDPNGDGKCDYCELGTPCIHGDYEASTSTNSNGNNTHTVTTTCGNCGMDIDYDTVDCTDENKDLICDVCEGEMTGIYWSLSESGVLTIYGKGPMEDYASFTGMPWSAQRDTVTEIVIEEGVTHIGARSFYRCILATKVTIAASVETIGDSAFYRCDSLKTVSFGGDKAQWTALQAAAGTNNEKLTAATDVTYNCAHTETTEAIASNADGKTHTVTTTCTDCGNVTTVVVDCEGETVYTELADGKHAVTAVCDDCDQVLVDELADCEEKLSYTDNGDRTHTVTTICGLCEAQLSTASEKCVDVKTDEDERCDKCGADLHCDHISVTKTITSDATAKTHTVTSTCDVCEEVVNVETVTCEGAPVYTKLADGKHKVTVNCTVCKQLVSEAEVACTGKITYTSNGDRTHTVTDACTACEQVLSTEIVGCVDGEDEDELCDICSENLHCDHPSYVPAYNSNGDHKTHNYAFNCTVCGAEYDVILEKQACSSATEGKYTCDKCGQDFSCQHDEKLPDTYEYIVNADRTHTVITVTTCANPDCEVKELSRVTAETTTPCVDADNDDYCDICEGNLLCAHTVQIVEYTCNNNWTHTMQIFCKANACGDKLAEKIEVCTDRNKDEVCDICGGKCDHAFAVTYELEEGETHVKVETCTNEGCSKVVKTPEACNDTVHDSKCDACGDDMACAHIGKTEHVAKDGEVHDIVGTCTVCGAETSCEKCKDYIFVTEEACVDADHDQKCDDCKDDVACLHDSEKNDAEANNDGTHKILCAYCGEVLKAAVECTDGDDNDYCDICGYDLADIRIVGKDSYETLDKAMVAAVDGDEIIVRTKAVVEGAQNEWNKDITVTTAAVEDNYSIIVKGNLTINGGTFNIGGTYGIGVTGTLTVNGGEFNADEKSDYLIGNWGTTTINGGQFNGVYCALNNFAGTSTITGGTFSTEEYDWTGEYEAADVMAESGMAISGGVFSKPVEAAHCAAGYEPVDNGDGTYGVDKIKFEIAGSNLTLGNELEVNFLFVRRELAETGCTAVITQALADGTTRVTEVAQADWGTMGVYTKVSARIAAKEMADQLSIEIKNADGKVLNKAYSTSVRDYVGRALSAENTTAKVKTMVVDMVNYGASAQVQFKYNTEDLANNALTEEQAALATAEVTCTNKQVKDETVYGSNLSLEDSILLNVMFKGLKGKDVSTMYATITFHDYDGNAHEIRVEGSEFEKYGATGDIYKIVVDEIVLADAKQLVTVNVYHADGTQYGDCTDSVESYVARAIANNADGNGLYTNILKFATSAYEYLK